MHPPAIRRSLPVEQVRPFGGIGNVVAFRIAGAAKVVGDLDVQGEVRIGEALELDVEVLAHDAARALGTNDIGTCDLLGLGGLINKIRDNAIAVLLESRERGRQAQVDVGMHLRHPERFLDDLDALALEHVRKARVVLEMDVIERRDQLIGGAIPVMKNRRDDATRLELPVKPDAVIHLQGGRVIGARPWHLLEEIILSERLDNGDRYPLLGERQRQAKTHRPSSDDNDTLRRAGHRTPNCRLRPRSPLPACGERSEFVPLPQKWGGGGPAHESEPAEGARPSSRPSPRKSGEMEKRHRAKDETSAFKLSFNNEPAAYGFATTSFAAPAQPVWVRSNTTPLGSWYFAS